jgi:(2Fe-2S) ferredoxin
VCNDSDCAEKSSQALYESLKRIVGERNLREKVKISKSTCLDDCSIGPNVVVYPQGIIYNGVSEKDLEDIVNAHLKGRSMSKLAHHKFLEKKT